MIPSEYIKNLYKAGLAFLVVLSLFFVVKVLSEFKDYRNQGSMNVNTITLSGHGEVKAVPDVASVSFGVRSALSTQELSSNEVNAKMAKILDLLKNSGIEEKDIKTENYTSSPKYSYPKPCPPSEDYIRMELVTTPCVSNTEPKIIGYTVSQNVNVKIRNVDDASKIIDGLNKIGVTDMSGPNLSIDDEDGLKMEARKQAIVDAKAKAELLAEDLGVRLGRIVTFSENGFYMPMYSAKAEGMSFDTRAQIPSQIPKGENTITSDVSITYEIH